LPEAICGIGHAPIQPIGVPDPLDPNLPPLEEQRARIDNLDEQILRLLNERARAAVEIGRIKQQSGTPVYAPDREKLILDKLRELNPGPLPARAIDAIYREIMSGSFSLERPPRVGYLGPAGSFSHAAAVAKFGRSVDYTPLDDIASLFHEIVRGTLDYGLVPIENSIHGGVIDTLDAMMTTSARICAEVLVTIHHHLLAKESFDHITRIVSRQEALNQCRNWLHAMAGQRTIEAAASTSKAAERASQEPGVAAIGSALAGELYGLQCLFEKIEDNPDNITRFFVIGREPARRSGDDKTAIMFRTADRPGALAAVLDVFRDNGINLSDIEKRPSRRASWEYYFFIDADGHADDPAMQRAIDQARQHCPQLTLLGSYPRAHNIL
jgi:chorismate mutase/prephenate dehydratase